ncbi:ABC transporter ATP-binding protein [Brachybacterium sp. ACRRE]|uniref:ABC transporter ATP-binding protein n=1 Tax=Brachybacterium sp. ACRRE TaxID=2918184 RepID=UPI001EF28E11|nr:ATP-binding cassette domain-containing protein [Brachybacterium sp. ACRRE]MCG7308529.1 ATP-binding cassette domain-containing protein [Brachybacterium sp. ACRRE]
MNAGSERPTGAGLAADLVVRRESFDVRARLEVPPGGRLALLGPNGAGKSTILGALAGAVPLAEGRIAVTEGSGDQARERVLDAPGRRSVPTHLRGITLLEQRPLLFPHLDLVANVAFGLRARGMGRRQARALALDWLERVGLADRAAQRPHRLSGGQQQRVALARAFAAGPSVILLDEPFAALDAESTPRVRGLLTRELARTGTTALLVTHQLSDAWDLADRCVVLESGTIRERTAPEQIATTPRSRFGARLAGFGVIEGMCAPAADGAARPALRVGDTLLPGAPDPDAPPPRGESALGIAAPEDVDLLPLDDHRGRAGVVGQVIGVQASAGRVRIEADNGLIAQVSPDAAARATGGGLPVVGSRLRFAPSSLRLVQDRRQDEPAR